MVLGQHLCKEALPGLFQEITIAPEHTLKIKTGTLREVPVDHAYSALGRVWFRCAESSILGTFRRSVVTLGKRYADRKNGVCSVLHTFTPHSHVTGAPKHDGVTSRNPPASADGRRNPSQDMGVF